MNKSIVENSALRSNVEIDNNLNYLEIHDLVKRPQTHQTTCRFCETELVDTMVNLGLAPYCEDFITEDERCSPEIYHPLEVLVCSQCWLVQTREMSSNTEIFDEDYGYFSSYSSSWLHHAKRYVDMAVERFSLTKNSFVVEVASNDGYLLKNFVERHIPCLGIDPARNVALAAESVGVPTRVEFFTESLVKQLLLERPQPDLIIGNNVLAHTPYISDFVQAVSLLLKPGGTATFEFPHLLELVRLCQFDTIYHEHYSYFSLFTVSKLFKSVGMRVVDVEKLPTAGGSLRVFVQHDGISESGSSEAVTAVLNEEVESGLFDMTTYRDFGHRASTIKNELLEMLIRLKREGKSVIGYGAPGKGNTLLNYCGIKPDLLPLTCDLSKHKHARYCPGSRIPIYSPEIIEQIKPDYVVILPWNLKNEIMTQLEFIREWGGKFIIPIPSPVILD